MSRPTARELRLFSDLAYSDLLTEYYIKEGRKRLISYDGFSDKYHDKIDKTYPKPDNNGLHVNFHILFSNWILFDTVQNLIKITKIKDNPLLDGFVFKSAFDDIFVIAFRGTNPKNRKQRKQDMIQNLSLFLADRDPNTQLGQAEVLVKLVIKSCLGLNPHQPSNSISDLSEKIFVTGHSKGGGLAQSITCILREEFEIKVKGVTFSATPIYLFPSQLKKPSKDWDCENYILASDRVLSGLSFFRFLKFRRLLKSHLKKNKIKQPKNLRLRNLKKLWNLTKQSSSGYVGGITKTFDPQPDFLKHSLEHYDKYFNHDGSL
ncbi:hypothetical protein [Bacillus nitratireducens]|uniref:hypothetical protein n=1 Tax=Bacillus nitratireducens TaxID=2026193 RepID=UPI002E1B58E8|nr:hypothetical protein [Bacillus nitratireducens]